VASQTAVASIPDEAGWLRNTAAMDLAGAMDRRGGSEELKRWFGSLPVGTANESKCKEKAMEATAKHLAHRDLTAARQWLETQPPEPWRSKAAYALVAKKIAETDRAAALSWLAAIPAGTATVGREAGREIFRAWQEEKPDEAMQWMRTVTDPKFLADIGALKKAPGERPAK
jgi:hypothetical protein